MLTRITTPSPWVDWNDEEDNWLLVQADTQQVIARFPKCDDEEAKEESLANCQLCAAAPEILAALRGFLAIFNREGSYVSPLVQSAVSEALAAIAKAGVR